MSSIGFRIRTAVFSTTWQNLPCADKRLWAGLLLLHFLLCSWFIGQLEFTADESDYFSYAVRWAHGHSERVNPTDDSKSPIIAVALVPTVVKPFIDLSHDPYGFFMLQLGRYCMYLFQLLGAYFLFCFMHRLWGGRYWILPMVLYLFDPTVFSYGMIVGTDMPSASLVVAACYCAWRYHQTKTIKYWVATCVLVGLAVVAKASMIYLPVLLLLLMTMAGIQQKSWAHKGFAKRLLLQWVGLVFSMAIILHAAYLFKHSFFSWEQLPEKSEAFARLKQSVSWLPVVPLPYDYVSAFDLLKYHAELGGGPKNENTFVGVSILNNFYQRGPVWYYYLAAFWLKLPVLTLLLLATSTILFFLRFSIKRCWDYLFIWLPPLFFLLLLSTTNPFQIGIRHALMVYPFLYLFTGWSIRFFMQRKPVLFRWMVLLQLFAFVMYWPNMIAYTNELFWPKKIVYRYLNDSSVSYQHAGPYLKKFLAANPDYRLPGAVPAPGKYAVLMEYLANEHDTYGYKWLYQHFEPSGHYLYNIALFEISEADLKKKGLVPAK